MFLISGRPTAFQTNGQFAGYKRLADHSEQRIGFECGFARYIDDDREHVPAVDGVFALVGEVYSPIGHHLLPCPEIEDERVGAQAGEDRGPVPLASSLSTVTSTWSPFGMTQLPT